MGVAITSPEEWRRRAGAPGLPVWEGRLVDGDLRSATAGLQALGAGDEETAAAAARTCRQVVWEQPDDAAGVVAAPDLTVLAHRGPQPFGVLGVATGFLARMFEAFGDDDDLDAAAELHDLTVALGDDVWEGPEAWPVGWGAAILYGVTGEDAFLATAERVADAMCEESALPAGAAALLVEMADAVEARVGVDQAGTDDAGADDA